MKEIWNHSHHSCNHHWIVRNDSDEVGEVAEDVIYFCRNSDLGEILGKLHNQAGLTQMRTTIA